METTGNNLNSKIEIYYIELDLKMKEIEIHENESHLKKEVSYDL